MIDLLLEPFAYNYMFKAIWVCALVGGVCAFLSSYLMLKGWSLMGDALAHSIVPGVALAYLLALPYAVGAFFAGILASLSMAIVKQSCAKTPSSASSSQPSLPSAYSWSP
jgi:manganese/iron transport system permease protein